QKVRPLLRGGADLGHRVGRPEHLDEPHDGERDEAKAEALLDDAARLLLALGLPREERGDDGGDERGPIREEPVHGAPPGAAGTAPRGGTGIFGAWGAPSRDAGRSSGIVSLASRP